MISKLNALKDKELSNGSKKIKSRKIDKKSKFMIDKISISSSF